MSVRHLVKRYGPLQAVADLSFDVRKGAIFGLIGPNGAGKSTAFSVMASLLKPTSGEVRVAGWDPSKDGREVRRRVGYMPDVLGVYDNLRVDEYLTFYASAYGVPKKRWHDLVGDLLELVDLQVKRDSMVNSLSRGMKQRLSLARALVHDPEVLILDEPASGLDPRARVELRDLLLQLAQMGKTLVISSHILSEMEELCTDVAVLEAGRLRALGAPRDILDHLGGHRTLRVTLSGGDVREYTVDDEAQQLELLRRLLVDEELPVTEFTVVGRDLEQLFLAVTEGIVQ